MACSRAQIHEYVRSLAQAPHLERVAALLVQGALLPPEITLLPLGAAAAAHRLSEARHFARQGRLKPCLRIGALACPDYAASEACTRIARRLRFVVIRIGVDDH